MSKKTLNLLFFTLLSIAFVNLSCKKNKLNKETTTAQDNTIAGNMFDGLFNTLDTHDDTEKDIEEKSGEALNDTCFTHPNYSCLTICKEFIDVDAWERKITLDFGSSDCVTADGKKRKGKIIAHRKGRYREEGSSSTISTENYYVEGYRVEGTRTIKNLGRNSDNKIQLSVDVSGEITTPDNKKIIWTSSRVNTWVEGSETWVFGTLNEDGSIDEIKWLGLDGIYDDVWEITGNSQGTNREDRPFDATITTPLRVQWCPPHIEITKGIIEIQPEDLKLRTVNFGAGNCDNEATVEVGNKTFEFNFR